MLLWGLDDVVLLDVVPLVAVLLGGLWVVLQWT